MRSTSTIESIHRGIWLMFGTLFVLFGIAFGLSILPSLTKPSEAERAERERVFVENIRQAVIKGGKRCDTVVKYEWGKVVPDFLVATCRDGKRTFDIGLNVVRGDP